MGIGRFALYPWGPKVGSFIAYQPVEKHGLRHNAVASPLLGDAIAW